MLEENLWMQLPGDQEAAALNSDTLSANGRRRVDDGSSLGVNLEREYRKIQRACLVRGAMHLRNVERRRPVEKVGQTRESVGGSQREVCCVCVLPDAFYATPHLSNPLHLPGGLQKHVPTIPGCVKNTLRHDISCRGSGKQGGTGEKVTLHEVCRLSLSRWVCQA